MPEPCPPVVVASPCVRPRRQGGGRARRGGVAGLAARAAVVVVVVAGAGGARAESYVATGSTTLARDGATGELVQVWSSACESVDPDPSASLLPGGRELRFAAARDQVLVVGDQDDLSLGVTAPLVQSTGTYRYAPVDGAYVFARLDVRCGGPAIVDTLVVESLPIVTPPGLAGPFGATRTDTLVAVDLDALPVGVEVELAGLEVRAQPRGDDRVELRFVGAGLDERRAFSADDFADGRLQVAPRLTPAAVGALVVTASLRDVDSAPLPLTVVGVDAGTDDAVVEDAVDAGCAAAGDGDCAWLPWSALAILPLGVRRRRSTAAAPRVARTTGPAAAPPASSPRSGW
jgi:hypothetical protein